jgi:hypothetical protein
MWASRHQPGVSVDLARRSEPRFAIDRPPRDLDRRDRQGPAVARAVLLAVIGIALAGCGGTTAPTRAPTTADAPADAGGRIVITTQTGLEFSFDAVSCMSPGPAIVNLKGVGTSGELDLRTSVQGGFRIEGPVEVDAEIDEIEVADDGSITAAGTLALADEPDVRLPFQLGASPGPCDGI